jgi:hypothetical protein
MMTEFPLRSAIRAAWTDLLLDRGDAALTIQHIEYVIVSALHGCARASARDFERETKRGRKRLKSLGRNGKKTVSRRPVEPAAPRQAGEGSAANSSQHPNA